MHQITVNGLAVDVVRKEIKNLHLAVYPPDGRVRVATPLRVTDEAVRLAVISRLSWIKRQQTKYREQERESEREYVSGESHYFQGSRYRLNVVYLNIVSKVVIRNKSTLDLYVRPTSTSSQRQKIISAWYRAYLREAIPPLMNKWEGKLGVKISGWGIKQMKTKWGACNIGARRIWLNLELAKKPVHCLEYIIAHELIHSLERNHNARFVACMDKYMPQWRSYRDELNRFPVSHQDWKY